MFDSETLRPVIIGMALYIVLSHILPKIIKKPTNIKPVDEINMLLISNRGFLMAGTILTGLVVFLANYINSEVL
jgi:hypothetical protein